MVVHGTDRRIARQMYTIAVGIVAAREHPKIAEIARRALDHPSSPTIRALLAAGAGANWLPSIIDALAEVGIAASEDVLSDPQ